MAASNDPTWHATLAFTDTCCKPGCEAPASSATASQVPLCEVHILDVYKAVNRMLTVENPKLDEYALLPLEQQRIPGPCPACGHAGYLMLSVADRIRCLSAFCYYESSSAEFEQLRRRLLYDLAGERSVVYYLKFGDWVKIGTTTRLKQRLQKLQTVEMLYGFEFGGRKLERRRHDNFIHYRMFGEWFEDNTHIRGHINNVCVTAA